MKIKVNIYEVAKLSGVSIATVSRVVNGSDKVSEKTRQKVLSIMDQYDYVPNVFARGLGLNSMKSVGILCPDISDAYVAQVVSFLEKNLRKNDYNCILGCSGHDLESKAFYTKLLLSKRIDALIMVGSTYAGRRHNPESVAYVREASEQVPVFMVNGYVKGDHIYCSFSNDFKAVYEVTTGLIRRGKKKILFLSDSHSYSALRKLDGYEAALQEAGYPILGDLKIYTKNQIHYARDILLAYKNLEFDAVVATEDGLAIGAVKYAKIRGLRIPEDIQVIGYNNSQLAVSCEPELTSIDNHVEKICSDTVDFMMQVLNGNKDVIRKNEVLCDVVRRCTTDF